MSAEKMDYDALAAALLQRFEFEPAHETPQKTDRCLSLPALAPGASRDAWTDRERAHVAGCEYCQRMIGIGWRLQCPSRTQLVRYAVDPDSAPDRKAMEFHLVHDGCDVCEEREQEPWFVPFVEALRTAGKIHDYVVGVFQLPAVPIRADDKDAPLTYGETASDADSRLGLHTFRDSETGHLVVQVQSLDLALGGKTVAVRIGFGTEGEMVHRPELRDIGGKVSARLDLGPMEAFQEPHSRFAVRACFEE